MNYNQDERKQYNHSRNITCERLDISKNEYNSFRLIGNELHKVYENNCNYGYSDKKYFGLTVPLEDEATYKAEKLGLHIYFQTDPRGATIYLSKEPIPDNQYNTMAECVY